jgi:hypothetical protein
VYVCNVSLDVEIAVNYLEIGPSVSEAELQPNWVSRDKDLLYLRLPSNMYSFSNGLLGRSISPSLCIFRSTILKNVYTGNP